jgi:hypothetical protein
MTYISITNCIILALLSQLALSLALSFISCSHEIIILHHISTNETSFKISMNSSCSLWCLCSFSNGPSPHLILTSSEEIYQIQSFISSLDNLGKGSSCLRSASFLGFFLIGFLFLLFSLLAFEFGRVGDDSTTSILINPFLDRGKPLVSFSLKNK